jgi:hypothetical protein
MDNRLRKDHEITKEILAEDKEIKKIKKKKISEAIEPGKYYKLDVAKAIKGMLPQQAKIVKTISKHGDGEAYVDSISKDGKFANIAENPIGVMIGTTAVPIEALKESVSVKKKK